MVRPERRTRGDVVAAVAIAVVVAVVAAVVWWTSDARATISRPATEPVPSLTPATVVPATLEELWTAPSAQTTAPLVVAGTVVTGDGREVTGRDPITGNALWSYARDKDLCGLTSVYQSAVAVYPDARGCGQVSTIDAKTGKRGPARTGYADPEVTLSSDAGTVLSAGASRLEMWRSDMVRMLSWGALDARVKPDVPASPLCRLVSAAASSSAASVLESCPQQTDMRLTLLRPSDEEDTPEVKFEQLTGVSVDAEDARVIAVADTTTAVYLPTPKPVVNIVDDTGTVTASTLLDAAASPHAVTSKAGDLISWWTGHSVLVFDADLRYKYTVSPTAGGAPVGPATRMAGELLIPVSDGYDVFNADTGVGIRHIDLQRPARSSAIVPAVAGSTVLEQRGDHVVALGG